MKSDTERILAGNLRYLRELHQMSQEAAAEEAQVSRVMYNRYEQGKSVPSLDKLLILADAFGVSATTLTDTDLSQGAIPGAYQKQLHDLCMLYRELSVISRKVILEEIYLLQDLESQTYNRCR